MSAPRRPSSTTARRRRFLAPLPAVLAVLLGAGLAHPASAAAAPGGPSAVAESGTPTPTPTPTPTEDEDEDEDEETGPRLVLEPADDTILPQQTISATATIENPFALDGSGVTPLPEGSVTLRIGEQPLADRAALDAWVDGTSSARLVDLDTADADAVAPGGSADVALEETGITRPPRAPGVYPLRAVYDGEGMQLQDDRLLIVDGDSRPLVSVVVPITAPATDRGLLTREQLAELTAPGGALTSQLEAAAGTQATLAVDPAIPAAIRVLGSNAPATALTWLERLESMPNERFALQFGDADLSTQLAAAEPEPLAPIGLAPYLPGAGEQAEGTPAPSPSPTPTPRPTSSPSVPDPATLTTEELLSIGRAIPDVHWPDPLSVSAATVDAIAAQGGTALVPSDVTAAGSGGAAVPARGEGALVYDATASGLLSEAAAMPDAAERAEALETARASIWLAGSETGSPVLVALARAGGIDTGVDNLDRAPSERPLEATTDAVTAATTFATRPLSALLGDTPTPVEVTGTGPSPERVAAIGEFRAAEQRLSEIGSVLSDPTLLTSRARAEALQLLGSSWSAHPDAWAAAMTAQRTSLSELANAVGIVPPSDVQLLSSEAPLPVWVHNDLPYPVTVTLFARPDDPRLKVQLITQVEAAPAQNTRVRIPVEATIGGGQVRIDLSLQSPTGVMVGSPQSMQVTVRADWERVGLVALAALIVGLVVLGTIRTVRRRRRLAREEPAADAEGPADPDAPGRDGSDPGSDPDDSRGSADGTAASDAADNRTGGDRRG